MEITEKNIFDLTFFSKKLSIHISNTIQNSETISPFIQFNTKLKENLISDISFFTKMGLENAIPDYNKSNIRVKPIKKLTKTEIHETFFPDLDKRDNMKLGVFQDRMRDITIQTYCCRETTILTILPNWNVELKDFSLKILPQNKEYKVSPNTVHINIGIVSDIEEIEIIF